MKTRKKSNTNTDFISEEAAPNKALRREGSANAEALSKRFFHETEGQQALDLTIDINWPY